MKEKEGNKESERGEEGEGGSTYKRETSITEPSFDMGLTSLVMVFKHLIFHCPQSFCLWHFTIFPVETLCLTLALFCSILTTLSSEHFSPHLSQSAKTVGHCSFWEMQCLPSTVLGSPPNDEIHVMIMYHFCQFLPTHSVTVAHAQTVQAFNHICGRAREHWKYNIIYFLSRLLLNLMILL